MPENGIWYLVALVGVFIITIIFNRVVRSKTGGARSSDPVYILRCDHEAMPFMAGMTLSNSSGYTLSSAGMLKFTVGVGPFKNLPSRVEIKFMYIDSNKEGKVVSGTFAVEPRDALLGFVHVAAPSAPWANGLVCKFWIITAYYSDGSTWRNQNAAKDEQAATKFMMKKLGMR